MKRNHLLKSLFLLCALMVGSMNVWAAKITNYEDIVSGKSYYIGATTSSTDYYLSVDGSSVSDGVSGTAVTNKASATVFVLEGSGTSWAVKFLSSGYYLSLASSKANGKVNIVASSTNWTASNNSSKIRLTIGSYSLQKNNSGTQFGSYGNTQTDVWLVEADVPSHTASFSINGVIDDANNDIVEEGAAITFPIVPANISGKTFLGWTNTTISGEQAEAPATLITEAVMGKSDITYYAVFAKETLGEGNVTKTITKDTDNLPDSYGTANTFSECTLDGIKFQIQQMYVNGTKLQWRASGNASGTGTMYNDDALNKIQSVVLTYDASDNNKNFTVMVGDDKNPSSGTEITPSSSGSVYTFDCSAYNKNYFVMKNGSGAGYLTSVSITYIGEITVYTDYCTTVIPGPSDPVDNGDETITLTTTVNMDGWRAFYDGTKGYEVDANTTVYTVSATSGTAVTLKAEAGKIIPADNAVVLKTTDAGHSMTLTETATAATLGTNILTVSDGVNDVDGYRLGYGAEDGIAFYKYTATKPAAGIVYIPKSSMDAPSLALEFEETTAIKNVNNDKADATPRKMLKDGRMVIETTEGIFLMNGSRVK